MKLEVWLLDAMVMAMTREGNAECEAKEERMSKQRNTNYLSEALSMLRASSNYEARPLVRREPRTIPRSPGIVMSK